MVYSIFFRLILLQHGEFTNAHGDHHHHNHTSDSDTLDETTIEPLSWSIILHVLIMTISTLLFFYGAHQAIVMKDIKNHKIIQRNASFLFIIGACIGYSNRSSPSTVIPESPKDFNSVGDYVIYHNLDYELHFYIGFALTLFFILNLLIMPIKKKYFSDDINTKINTTHKNIVFFILLLLLPLQYFCGIFHVVGGIQYRGYNLGHTVFTTIFLLLPLIFKYCNIQDQEGVIRFFLSSHIVISTLLFFISFIPALFGIDVFGGSHHALLIPGPMFAMISLMILLFDKVRWTFLPIGLNLILLGYSLYDHRQHQALEIYGPAHVTTGALFGLCGMVFFAGKYELGFFLYICAAVAINFSNPNIILYMMKKFGFDTIAYAAFQLTNSIIWAFMMCLILNTDKIFNGSRTDEKAYTLITNDLEFA